MTSSPPLTLTVTGPTGTLGSGLVPLLEADPRIGRVVGIARRPFDPSRHGWDKMAYHQGDIRDRRALKIAFAGSDVVVHLAFLVTGGASRATIRAINVDGTVNAFRAAAAAGVERFVYASSVAAYGFHPDNPIGMTEEWPVRPATRLFYAREKAELEHLLVQEAEAHPHLALYRLRPPVVLGPHALGGKGFLPRPLTSLARPLTARFGRLPIPVPALVPAIPVQFVHEEDVGQALLLAVVGAGPPGAYNVAGDGVMTAAEVARELGFAAWPLPAAWAHRPARLATALARMPLTPPVLEWVEALSQPSIMDSGKAKRELGWKPRYTTLGALRATVRSGIGG